VAEARWLAAAETIAADRVSGASDIAVTCAGMIGAYLQQEVPGSTGQLLAWIGDVARPILARHGMMAPVVGIFNCALLAIEREPEPDRAAAAILALCKAVPDSTAHAVHAAAMAAAALLDGAARVVTISSSRAVYEALRAAGLRSPAMEIVCLESRPGMEGRDQAERLAKAGCRVVLAVDAAAYLELGGSDAWIVGADSIGVSGVVNKVGTATLAVCAARQRVKGYVVADTSKLWPALLRLDYSVQAEDANLPLDWPDKASGLRVATPIYDRTPLDYITGMATENGVKSPGEIEAACNQIRFARALPALLSGSSPTSSDE
jgi:translation initiation factor 2B subunit (eIF-2B alpha/beta/delta family)